MTFGRLGLFVERTWDWMNGTGRQARNVAVVVDV